MLDYSSMNYDQLRGIADNDSVADNMSDEEYELLSAEMWRKFTAEKCIPEREPSFAGSSASLPEAVTVGSFLRNLRARLG